VGRWEGNTLVVDTTNFSDQSRFFGAGRDLHLVERLTRLYSDTLEYQITLDDQTTWTRPWTAVINLKTTSERIFEFACHEGSFEVIRGLLGAARAAECGTSKRH